MFDALRRVCAGAPGGLRRSERGSAAAVFAFSLMPVIAAAGAAVDGLYAFMLQSQLSHAVDAAAVAGARALKEPTRDAQVNQYFRVNFSSDVPVDPLAITADVDAGTLSVTATASSPTHFMKLFGMDAVPLSAQATAQTVGAGGMELAMVLDVTGSMKGSKLESLKQAGNNLLNAIYGDKETVRKLSVSVVPFAGRVNINPHREWMTTQPLLWQYWWYGCVDERSGTAGWDDTPPTNNGTKFTDFKPNGSVLKASDYCSASTLLPLTAEKSKVKAALDGLVAKGNTRTDIGMAWGWRTISPRWRGTWPAGGEAAPADYDDGSVRKVVVLMTDGENTPQQSADAESEATTYTLLKETCQAMKDEGVIVYTITFQAPTRIETHYESCATTPEHHFISVPTEEALRVAFGRIGDELAGQNVRLIR